MKKAFDKIHLESDADGKSTDVCLVVAVSEAEKPDASSLANGNGMLSVFALLFILFYLMSTVTDIVADKAGERLS